MEELQAPYRSVIFDIRNTAAIMTGEWTVHFYRSLDEKIILVVDGDTSALARVKAEMDVVVQNDVTPPRITAGLTEDKPRIRLVHVPPDETLGALRAALEPLRQS